MTTNENGVRVDRIDDLIAQIKEYGSVFMAKWQTRSTPAPYANAPEQLHPCGNRACIGGHLAINKMFREAGGESWFVGEPYFDDHLGSRAFLAYMGGSRGAANTLILGAGVKNWGDWDANDAVRALELYKTLPPDALYSQIIEIFGQIRGDK